MISPYPLWSDLGRRYIVETFSCDLDGVSQGAGNQASLLPYLFGFFLNFIIPFPTT
jgi:hypothetical protein